MSLLTGIVVGGLGTIAGAVIGGLFVQFLPYYSNEISQSAPTVVYGVIIILVMILAPGGVIGLLRRFGAWLSGKRGAVARRRRGRRGAGVVPDRGRRPGADRHRSLTSAQFHQPTTNHHQGGTSMKATRRGAAMLAVLGLGLGLVACRGSDDDDASSDSVASEATPAPAATSAAHRGRATEATTAGRPRGTTEGTTAGTAGRR